MNRFGFLKVAAAVPHVRIADCDYNAQHITELIRKGADRGASIILFPELCITSYTCGDLIQQPALLHAAEQALGYILAQTRELPIVAIVGMPVTYGNALYNCAVVFAQGRIHGVVPKTYIPNYSEFYEARCFMSGEEIGLATIRMCGQDTDFGRNMLFNIGGVKFGVEICEDMWVPAAPSLHQAVDGAQILFNLSASPEVLGKHNYLRVDVKNPQFKVIVEIRDYGAYIHGPKIQGEGGLPVGTSGRALNMLSGGIDSPVAAYRMAKRGLGLDHIHFASPPYTSERAKLKVKALAQRITPYTGSTNLFVVPYTKPQEYIRDNAPDVLFTVLMRRSMMRIANIIAKKQGCEALVTGESLAQVASQTVKALQCTDAAQDLPILRPLIGMDKTEIVETARHINTFETSILPYEDCCTIFTPPHPKIRPELEEILEAEAGMPGLARLEAEAAEATERIRLRITDDVEFEG